MGQLDLGPQTLSPHDHNQSFLPIITHFHFDAVDKSIRLISYALEVYDAFRATMLIVWCRACPLVLALQYSSQFLLASVLFVCSNALQLFGLRVEVPRAEYGHEHAVDVILLWLERRAFRVRQKWICASATKSYCN